MTIRRFAPFAAAFAALATPVTASAADTTPAQPVAADTGNTAPHGKAKAHGAGTQGWILPVLGAIAVGGIVVLATTGNGKAPVSP